MTPTRGIWGAAIWTVARQTFVQCLRTRVAAVFTVLLIASLAMLPSLMEGDGTLAGRIRTFLDYSMTAVNVLLSLTVVLLSAGLISGDVAGKHVMVLCTKPLARWKYVLGRWLGVVMLAGMLLAGAYVAIYLTARYLRGRLDLAVGPQDARAVEMEVFAARTLTPAPEPNVTAIVEAEVQQKIEQGSWQPTIRSYMDNYGLNESEAAEKLLDQMRRAAASEAQSAGPGRSLTWHFENLPYGGEAYMGPGAIAHVDKARGVVTVQTSRDMARRLVIFGPVWIGPAGEGTAGGGAVGRIVRLWRDGFSAALTIDDMKSRFASGGRGQAVRVVARPTLQLSYRVSAVGKSNVLQRKASWIFENPSDGFMYYVPPQEVRINQKGTVIAPAAAVDGQGRMRVRFINQSPTSVTVLSDNLSVLYGLGGFEMNFVRSGLLALLGLMFLAALGLFASSWLGFAVACLACLVALLVGAGLGFLTEAISLASGSGETGAVAAVYAVAGGMLRVMKVLLPDLSSMSGTSFLVEGRRIPWAHVGYAALMTIGIRGAVLLGLGCWVFGRRELARVQV